MIEILKELYIVSALTENQVQPISLCLRLNSLARSNSIWHAPLPVQQMANHNQSQSGLFVLNKLKSVLCVFGTYFEIVQIYSLKVFVFFCLFFKY